MNQTQMGKIEGEQEFSLIEIISTDPIENIYHFDYEWEDKLN